MPIQRVNFSPNHSRSQHEPDQQRPRTDLVPFKPAPPGQAVTSTGAAAMATLSPASIARANDEQALNAATYASADRYTASGSAERSDESGENINFTA